MANRHEHLPHKVTATQRDDGSLLLQSGWPLGPVADNTSEWLHHWAAKKPGADFLMERSGAGWRDITYSETLQQVKALAAGLLSRGMNADTRLVVLSRLLRRCTCDRLTSFHAWDRHRVFCQVPIINRQQRWHDR